ncbi:MAG: DUF6146 family protein [Flavobacterium sp.]
MKNIILSTLLLLILTSCGSSKPMANTTAVKDSDKVVIANDSLEYEVIIIDSGFSTYLATTAYPRNYYSQSFLENKNNMWIREYNARARQGKSLYEMPIDYESNIDYGYEVNYLLYNYMVYFQNKYNQKLGGYVPLR